MLTADEKERYRKSFLEYDRDASGVIDLKKLKASMASLGLQPTEQDLRNIMHKLDLDKSGLIEFSDFVKIIEQQKAQQLDNDDDTDTLEAFVALGGQSDKTGCVSVEKLRRTFQEFELTIDIDRLLQEMGKDHDGNVDFKEFQLLLTASH